jgi:hypothetical protein
MRNAAGDWQVAAVPASYRAGPATLQDDLPGSAFSGRSTLKPRLFMPLSSEGLH